MYLKFEITGENIKKITELRKSGVNLTEYLNTLIKKEGILPPENISHIKTSSLFCYKKYYTNSL